MGGFIRIFCGFFRLAGLLNPAPYGRAVAGLARLLFRHRFLLGDMARRDVRDQYLGRTFGLFWAVAQPMIMIGLYLLAFVYIFKVRLPDNPEALNPSDSLTLYIISGLIPFFASQNVLTKSATVLTSQANLVKQVVFPIEVLPVKIVSSAFLTQSICTLILLGYSVFAFHKLSPVILLWPCLILAHYTILIGCSLVLAVIAPYFKDISDLVNIMFTLLFYGSPLFYNTDMLPEVLRKIMVFNPMHHLLHCYRDLFYESGLTRPGSWCVTVLMAIVSLGLGARVFNKLKTVLGNVL